MQHKQAPVAIIGVGEDGYAGLSEQARQLLDRVHVVYGTARVLQMMPTTLPATCSEIGTDLDQLRQEIAERLRQLVPADTPGPSLAILASGDPLFYGVARYLLDRLGKEHFEIVPHVSTMQLAFARVMESWEEAYLTDLERQSLEVVVERIRTAERVGLFTTATQTPAVVAQTLLAAGISYFRVYVCENLGSRNERLTQGTLEQIAGLDFGPLNVMILIRHSEAPDQPLPAPHLRLFGNPDEFFLQAKPKRGLLTPSEVRTLALGELDVRANSIVWDVGAGSGSVAIEAARLAPQGQVFAIEPDWEDGTLIRENMARFGVQNVTIVPSEAPAAFNELPTPTRIFLGGLGRQTVGILQAALARLAPGGTLVTNVATLENVTDATRMLQGTGCDVGVLLVNLARGIRQLDSIRFDAINPSFLVFADKPTA